MKNIRLILVSPKYSGNVGACARVASNFEVDDIYVTDPQCDIFDDQAKMYGKGPSREYLMGIKTVATLKDAIQDCSEAIAVTRRFGDKSPQQILLPDLLLPITNSPFPNKTALVFGREDNCLTREETALCSYCLKISTSSVMPTMNLSHAVAVVLSRLYTDLSIDKSDKNSDTGKKRKISIEEFEVMMEHWENALIDVGLTRGGDPGKMMRRIRRVMQRTELNEAEMGVFRRFLSKVQVKMR